MSEPKGRRPTWAEISLAALKSNFELIRRHLDADMQLMAVVKADAYGHGAVECARTLEEAGADWFGVALVEEGIELRSSGISRPIFCLGGFWRGQAPAVIEHDLTPAVFRLDALEELNDCARASGRTIGVHLKVDTGMGRFGVRGEDVADFARALKGYGNLRLDGLLTHFAEADAPDPVFTAEQIAQFEGALDALRSLGLNPAFTHLANSAGAHAHPRGPGNLARVGAALYGLVRDVLAPVGEPWRLRPVMSWHTRIVFLKRVPAGTALGYGRTFRTSRPSLIATLPVGYADGLHRAHSNNGSVIIRGRKAPIVGRVSMDLTIVDVTDVDGVKVGDEALIIGEQGGVRIAAEDLAAEVGTISYEIVCHVSRRVPRIYRDGPMQGVGER